MIAALTQQEPWQVAIRLLPLRHSHGPLSVIFSSIIKNQESLIVEEISREESIRGSPNWRGLNSFLVQAGVGDLDRIDLPGGQRLDSVLVT